MDSYRTSSRQVVKNTVFLYARSLFNLILSLYTSRLVLAALGVDDYGIYNAVGGFVSMLWMITGTLSSAITRFLTFEMGRQEQENLNKVFSLSLTMLLALAFIILLIAETFGVWFLRHEMTIPSGRETAAFWVFQTAVFTSIVSLIVTPFNSTIIAHEKFSLYAYIGIGETLGLFILALFLTHIRQAIDLLIVYAIVRAVISLTLQMTVTGYSLRHFEESRFRLHWDKSIFGQLFSYTGWSLLGSIAGIFNGQGVNVLLNVFFGPAVNAARGLAFTVTNSVGIFVNNFTLAVVPQVTKSYAANDRSYFNKLVFSCSKFAFFIMLFLVVPLSIETEFVLSVWLKEVPEYAVIFTRFSLIIALIAMFDNILSQAQRASGIIRNYQIITAALMLSSFLFSYLALKAHCPPVSVYIIGVFLAAGSAITTTLISSRTLDLPVIDIINKIYFREILVSVLSFVPPLLVCFWLPSGWLRFFLVLTVSIACTGFSACFLGCNQDERKLLKDYVSRFVSRFAK